MSGGCNFLFIITVKLGRNVTRVKLTCGHDPQHREQNHGHHGGDGEGEGLRQPEHGHQEDGVGTSQSLADLEAICVMMITVLQEYN